MKKSIFLSTLFLLFTCTCLIGQEKKAGQIVTNYFNWLDAGNLDAVSNLLTDDFTATAAFAPVVFDKKSWRGVGENFVTSYPGMKHEIAEWFADDNHVVVIGVFRAINTGPNMGNPPTGNSVTVPFTTVFQLDGKARIKKLDSKFDMKLFESQLMAGINPHAKNEANIRKAYSALEKRDYKSFASVCSQDFSELGLNPEPIKGVWNAVESYKPFLTAFPDIKFNITSIVPAGPNTYYLNVLLTGTNTGSFMGIPPTGKYAMAEDMDIVVVNDQGLCVSHRSINPNGLLQSIGILHKLDPRNIAAEAAVMGIMAAADAGDTEKLVSYFAPDAKHYFNGIANSNDELKNRVLGFKTGFPDVKRSLKVVASGPGTVSVQGWLTGTNKGMFMGKPATGNQIKVSALGVYKFNDEGKVTEAWVELDAATMLSQLKADKLMSEAKAKK